MKALIHIFGFFLLWQLSSFAQVNDTIVLNFSEYLGYVKKYHPIAKQAQLTIPMGQANLMKARGAFDPKIEVDHDQKQFKGTEYYRQLNAAFKIPTWYGLELKANYEQNEGTYLNPQLTVPEDGLYSAGVSASLGQGLFINERMATLKQAKLFLKQTEQEQNILINSILYEASLAYFDWIKAYNETVIFSQFLTNAEIRFQGIKKSAEVGDMAVIDSVEAKITVKNRKLSLEKATLSLRKASLKLSTFLWLDNLIPIELQPNVVPETNLLNSIDQLLDIDGLSLEDYLIENHPKLQSLNFKVEGEEIERRLKANKLLPKVDVTYNFLTQDPDLARSFNTSNYKGGFRIAMPLFLRKERGELELAKYKLADLEFERASTQVTIQNKIEAQIQEVESYDRQREMIQEIVNDYDIMLNAEIRMFDYGESSVFLLNTRELKLIEAELKRNDLLIDYLTAKADLFKVLANNPLIE